MTIEIKRINTKPEHDPYQNIEGIVSRTVFWLDPRDRTCGVEQEYRTNSTSMDRWNNLELYWFVADYPAESTMRDWIEENNEVLEKLCGGYSVEWNGNNMVGRLTEEARILQDQIEQELENGYLANYYECYTLDDWLYSTRNEIKAEMTDQELESLAEDWEPTSEIVIVGRRSILEYITEIRDELKLEKEMEEE